MRCKHCLIVVITLVLGCGAQFVSSQPPLLPVGLSGPEVERLVALEPLVWTDPLKARKQWDAIPPLDGEGEVARQLLLAAILYYTHSFDDFCTSVDRGFTAADPRTSLVLVLHLEILKGICENQSGHSSNAAARLESVVLRAREAELASMALWASTELSYVLAQGGRFEKALSVLQEVAEEVLLADEPFLRALADDTFSLIYTYLDEFDRAIAYAERAINGFSELGFPLYEAEAVNGLATAYRYQGNWISALEQYYRYQEIVTSQESDLLSFFALYGIGITHAERGACEDALPVIAQALAMKSPADYALELWKREAVCRAQTGGAEAAHAALSMAEKLVGGLPELKGTRWDIDILQAESKVSAALGQFDEAYFALKQYHEAEEALDRKNAAEDRKERRAFQENARQALQIELLEEQARVSVLEAERQQQQQRSERTLYLSLICALLLLSLIVLGRLRDARKFRRLSRTDALTGVANRRFIFEQLSGLLGNLTLRPVQLSVALIDIDGFKGVNDQWGHPAGDEVLKALAVSLSKMLRPGDLVGRIGGEEFMIVLPRTSIEGAYQMAERGRSIVEAMRVPLDEGNQVGVTVSIGIASISPSRNDPSSLYAAADEALYRAKHEGKNRVEAAGER